MGSLFSSSSNTNSSNQSSGSSNPTYSAGQTGLQDSLITALKGAIGGGPQGIFQNLQPLVTAGTNNINQANQGSQAQMDRYLASRGMGGGGVAGQSEAALQSQRLGQISGLNSSVAGMANQDFYQSLSDALDAAYKNPGSSFTQSGSGSSSTTSNPSIFSDLSGIAGLFSGAFGGSGGASPLSVPASPPSLDMSQYLGSGTPGSAPYVGVAPTSNYGFGG